MLSESIPSGKSLETYLHKPTVISMISPRRPSAIYDKPPIHCDTVSEGRGKIYTHRSRNKTIVELELTFHADGRAAFSPARIPVTTACIRPPV
jgi:hypothetical protein